MDECPICKTPARTLIRRSDFDPTMVCRKCKDSADRRAARDRAVGRFWTCSEPGCANYVPRDGMRCSECDREVNWWRMGWDLDW